MTKANSKSARSKAELHAKRLLYAGLHRRIRKAAQWTANIAGVRWNLHGAQQRVTK